MSLDALSIPNGKRAKRAARAVKSRSSIDAVLARHTGRAERELELEIAPLSGGLVSASVKSVRARYRDRDGTERVRRFVVKQLDGTARREAEVYRALAGTSVQRLAPALVAVERCEGGRCELFLQQIVPQNPWPWRDVGVAASVLRSLAGLHEAEAAAALREHVRDWNYERELELQAARLIECLEMNRAVLRGAGVDLRLSLIRRLAARLSELRRQLLSQGPFGTTVIHGDVHPGNVMVLERGQNEDAEAHQPILLDWARARLGSPLEDVSSWLQCLGYWEPVARSRHDTLLGEYLRARGRSARPTRELRDAYWLAAASNTFAGALLYHVSVALTPERPAEERHAALGAVRDQLRILRRADACFS